MKIFFILTFLLFSVLALAKNDVNFQKFNDAMSENIDTVIKHNPQIYEPKKGSRAPASVEINAETVEEAQERINSFDKQNVGREKW